jgi:hypothetical protein
METNIINGLKVVKNGKKTIVTLSDNKVGQLKDFLSANTDAIVLISPTSYVDEFGLSFHVADLEVLKELPEIKKVILLSNGMSAYQGLYHLKNLTSLRSWLSDLPELDFSFFKYLEDVEFTCTPKTKNFFECLSLRYIAIWKYNSRSKDLTDFSVFANLISLKITQSNIVSIEGIAHIKGLKSLSLNYNPKLVISLAFLGFKLPNIETLIIDNCKSIDFGFIEVFPNLKTLVISKLQPVESLRPILDGLPKLENLFVGETRIAESDNNYYLNYPHIKGFLFDDKKHHLLKNKDLDKDWNYVFDIAED